MRLKGCVSSLVCAVLAAAGGYLASEARRDHLVGLYTEARAAFETRPEVMVNVMAIDGAGTSVSEDIREVVPLDFPISSFDLDLGQIRDVIEGLDPVRTASVRILRTPMPSDCAAAGASPTARSLSPTRERNRKSVTATVSATIMPAAGTSAAQLRRARNAAASETISNAPAVKR